jgi:hypothetical protein
MMNLPAVTAFKTLNDISMKRILYMIHLLFTIGFGIAASAQLGGLINKAKDKASEIKTITGGKKNTAGGSNTVEVNSGSNTVTGNNRMEEGKQTLDAVKTQVKFEMAGDDGYSSGGIKYPVDELQREKPIEPYRHVRRVGEPGSFHFARDYAELKGIAEPELKNVSLRFSSTPFKGGAGTPATQFSSTAASHIYARLEAKGTSIKEALQISGEVLKLTVDFYVYPDNSDELKSWKGQSTLYVTEEQIAKSVLDFDIRPSANSITPYYNPKDRYSYYLSSFPNIHNNQFFPSSGKYMIGVRVVSDVNNEWGAFTGKKLEIMGGFEYSVNVKEAKAVYEEGQVVMQTLQNGMRKLPKPMPKEWKMSSAAPVVAGYTAAKYNQLYMNYYKGVKIVKTVLAPAAGTPWKIVSNDNIIPTYKYCTQTVYFFVKDAEGNCYYHPCDLRQDYAGGGTYGPVHLAVFDEERVYVKCEEMK